MLQHSNTPSLSLKLSAMRQSLFNLAPHTGMILSCSTCSYVGVQLTVLLHAAKLHLLQDARKARHNCTNNCNKMQLKQDAQNCNEMQVNSILRKSCQGCQAPASR